MSDAPDLGSVVDALASLAGVDAVALGGSRATGLDDAGSDSDLYAFVSALPGEAARAAALAPFADVGSVRHESAWGPEDHLRMSAHLVEVVYLSLDDIGRAIEQAYGDGIGDEAFATAFLHTVTACVPLRDDHGVLAAVRERLQVYPERTRARLLASLPTYLRSYLKNIEAAQGRGDLLSVQQRRASVQAVWFNLLFTLNRQYHPGEKRLLHHAESCAVKPDRTAERWQELCLLRADDPALVARLRSLIDDLLAFADTL